MATLRPRQPEESAEDFERRRQEHLRKEKERKRGQRAQRSAGRQAAANVYCLINEEALLAASAAASRAISGGSLLPAQSDARAQSAGTAPAPTLLVPVITETSLIEMHDDLRRARLGRTHSSKGCTFANPPSRCARLNSSPCRRSSQGRPCSLPRPPRLPGQRCLPLRKLWYLASLGGVP